MTEKANLYHNGKLVGSFPFTGDDEIDAESAKQALAEKGLLNQSTELEKISRQANAFEEATQVLYKSSPNLTVPFIVNGAFCIELLLKAIHTSLGRNEFGHELLDLYSRLPNSSRESVSDRFTSEVETSKFETLDSALSSINTSFVEWRYMHEKVQTSVITPKTILEVISVLKAELNAQHKT